MKVELAVISVIYASFLLGPVLSAQRLNSPQNDLSPKAQPFYAQPQNDGGQWQPLSAGPGQPLVLVSEEGGGNSFGSNAAMYATACFSPMVIGWIPFIGPALTGWFVQLVGDSVTHQKKSPMLPILGAYAGQYLLVPTCVGLGYIAGFIFYLGGAAVENGSGATSVLGSLLSLGSLIVASVVGVAGAAAIPVVAYNMSEDQGRPRTRSRRRARRRRDEQEDWQDEDDYEEYSAPQPQTAPLHLLAAPIKSAAFAY